MSRTNKSSTDQLTVLTIGHSTRTDVEMLALLKANHVTLLADVRTMPRSRTNPQFNTDTFAAFLAANGIRYEHIAALGGLRKARKDTQNVVWKNDSFRGYADYMETDEFRQAVDRLLEAASKYRVAIMCSEAVWWRCHRSMIADELVARGVMVEHIMGARNSTHTLRSFAAVDGNHVSYRSAG
jgi:uncharacterized protein (DUF488 family)